MQEPTKKTGTADVFISFSHQDAALQSQLIEHLALQQRQGNINAWHAREISPGEEWKGQIDLHVESADIILLLVSPAFIASDYCWDHEMKHALERHDQGQARVVPIIIRACDWRSSPFGKLQELPESGSPVTSWDNRDEAWEAVVQGIRSLIDESLRSRLDRAEVSQSRDIPGHKRSRFVSHIALFAIFAMVLATIGAVIASHMSNDSITTIRIYAESRDGFRIPEGSRFSISGISGECTEEISTSLQEGLVRSPSYDVISSRYRDKITDEQTFGWSLRANSQTAPKLGELMGVSLLIIGEITKCDVDRENFVYKRAHAHASLKVIDIETGRVIHSGNYTGASDKKLAPFLGTERENILVTDAASKLSSDFIRHLIFNRRIFQLDMYIDDGLQLQKGVKMARKGDCSEAEAYFHAQLIESERSGQDQNAITAKLQYNHAISLICDNKPVLAREKLYYSYRVLGEDRILHAINVCESIIFSSSKVVQHSLPQLKESVDE